MFHIWTSRVAFRCTETYGSKRACCACVREPPSPRLRLPTASLSAPQEKQQAEHASPQPDFKTFTRDQHRHSGGSKSVGEVGGEGAAGSDTGGGEGRAPTYIQTLLRSPCTACRAAVHRYAYKPPVNYFPDGGQKNSQSDSTSTVSTG